MNLFKPDSPLYKIMSMVFDIMLIGLLWIITSIPVLTIGASTSAAYTVMMRRVKDSEQAVIVSYFKAFAACFKYATILFLILFVLGVLNFMSIMFTEETGVIAMLFNVFDILLAVEIIFIFIHAFPLIARYDLKFGKMLKTAVLMAHKHLFTTITHIALIIAIILLVNEFVPLFFVAFGLYCWCSSRMLLHIYKL